jgi:membrane protease YdiL (CAAX protease family)
MADPGPPAAPVDAAAFEALQRAMDAKMAARPDVAFPLEVLQGLALVIAAVGLFLLVRAYRRRAAASRPTPGPPVAPGWGVGTAVAAIAAVIVVTLYVAKVAVALGASDSIEVTIGSSIAGNLIGAGLLFALARAHGHHPVRALGLGAAPGGLPVALRVGVGHLVAAFPVYCGLHLLTDLAFRALGWPITPNAAAFALLTTDSTRVLVLIAAVAIVVAPLAEELLFRGFLYPALRKRLGAPLAVCVSAGLFALMHPPVDMPAILVLGCALALAYERAGSLYASIAAHALNNAWGIAMLAAERHVARA